jgi:hypothetical protein
MIISEIQTANVVAANLIQQWQNLINQSNQLIANGRPAQGNFSAFTANDLASALGDNLAKINNAIKALS